MSITSIAASGLRASQMRLTASASNVARSSVADDASTQPSVSVTQAPAPSGDTVARYAMDKRSPSGLVSEATAQMAAVQDFRANAKIVAASDEMMRSTLELWG